MTLLNAFARHRYEGPANRSIRAIGSRQLSIWSSNMTRIRRMNPEAFAIAVTACALLGVPAVSVAATDAAPLAAKYNCTACHAADKKIVGPAYKEVAAKY